MINAELVGSMTSPTATGETTWSIYAGVVPVDGAPATDALPIDPLWRDGAVELPPNLLGFILKTRQIAGSDTITVVDPSFIATGKNRGKKNQTNKFTQALSEARSFLTKRAKKKAVTYVHPMLATEVELEELAGLTYPLVVQEKLDGVRVIANQGKLQSRGGVDLPVPEQLVRDLQLLAATDLAWDGELFANYPLQLVSGAARRAKSKTAEEQLVRDALRVHIYDVVAPGTYAERLALMESSLPRDLTACVLVPSEFVDGPEAVRARFEQVIANKGEGVILRIISGPLAGPYEESINSRRSKQLYKLKAEYSAEGIIHAVIPGKRGSNQDAAILVVDTLPETFPARFRDSPSTRIDVVPNATIAERRKMLLKPEKYVGQKYTFTFQDVADSGAPLRARGITLRID